MEENKINEYPHCDSLIYSIATVLNAALTLSDVDDEKKLECNNVIVEWLERTAESPNEKVRISSLFMLAAKYIQMEKYKEANIFLDKIPDTVIDATIMKTNVLAHQEGTDIAAFFLEGKLMQTVTNIQNYLYKLIEMEEETGNHCKAEEIAEITEHMVSLFGLWDDGKEVPYLLIAVYRKDVEKCIQLIKEVLMESQKPWKMETMMKLSPEYRVMIGNVVSMVVAPPTLIGASLPKYFASSGAHSRVRISRQMLARRAMVPSSAPRYSVMKILERE